MKTLAVFYWCVALFASKLGTEAASGEDGRYEAELSPGGNAVFKKVVRRQENLQHNHLPAKEEHISESSEDVASIEAVTTTNSNSGYWQNYASSMYGQLVNISNSNPTQIEANNVALLSFMMLGGSMFFYVLVLYFITCGDQDIQATTWKVISGAMSLGCTALLFQSWRLLTFLQGSQQPLDPDTILAFSVCRWFGAMLVIPFMMRWFVSPVIREAVKELGGYFIGFAAIDAIGGLMKHGPWFQNPGCYFLGIQVYAAVFIAMMVLGWAIRRRIFADQDGNFKPDDTQWKLAVEGAEHNAFSLSIGLLLSALIRYAISHTVPELNSSPAYRSRKDVLFLLATAGIAAFTTMIISSAVSYFKDPRYGPIGFRFATLVSQTLELATAWLFFYYMEWQFWWAAHLTGVVGGSEVDELVAEMAVTMLTTVLVFILIFFTDKVADLLHRPRNSALRELHGSYSLLIGFSWEMSLYITIKGVGVQYQNYAEGCWAMLQLSLLILVIIVPLWWRVVLPRLLQVTEAHNVYAEQRDALMAQKQAVKNAEKKSLKEAQAQAAEGVPAADRKSTVSEEL